MDWMEEFKVSHLPVVDGTRLLGMVHDEALVDRNDPKAEVRTIMDGVEVPFVREGQHIYDVMKLMNERKLSVVPVVDMTGNYLGAVSEHGTLEKLAEVPNIRAPGSGALQEMNQTDYSLQEIARIVEGSDGKVLSVYSHSLPGSMKVEVTLKINREDISDILRTFERYAYFVKNTYQGSKFHDDLRGRYDALMRFIDL